MTLEELTSRYPNCTIDWNHALIADSVKIGPYSEIGSSGFGFEVEDDTTNKPKYRIPLQRRSHNYNVWIRKNVEIGSNCCIDRGSWRDTIIGEGSKLDSHVKIAHNVQLGKHCLVVAGTVIGGSVSIGDHCFIGISAGIKQRLSIGENSIIGMGAVVVKDVPPNSIVKGNPAK